MVRTIVLILLLAGCAAPMESGNETPVVTDPLDYSYVDKGDGSHLHDYWGGETTLELLNSASACPGCARASGGNPPDVFIASFRPGGGDVVLQGAKWVNVTASWTWGTGTDAEAVHLWVRQADATEYVDVGAISMGATVSIETANGANDPPHAQLSGWSFMLTGRGAAGTGEVRVEDWDVKLRATIAKGHAIEPWPAHPDIWRGASELPLVATSWTSNGDIALPFQHSCDGACFDQSIPILNGSIVAPNVASIVIEIDHDNDVPLPFVLSFHGGDTWNLSRLQPTRSDAFSSTFEIAVSTSITDSPYAKQSVWEFVLEPAVDRPYVYLGTMRATATMYR